ncbi:uracil-DNA glycosylase [Hippea maritima]|uniref:Type-4 uracil-DNA glycosylase n=1 Tax=Hippea maritima (strain ATCC 700847 / DSM 10411 / MH2) TaxID=760142 RepID=F2LXL6_HIPMA|nr:uracil-DNA glycosylase [Hippea maritima]AEA33202.1 phage SPO1 DNA polymerase-related protein [Hippea maritima DSM 10411]
MKSIVDILRFYKDIDVEYLKPVDIYTKEEEFEKLKEKALVCKGCELHKTRTNVVFGEGNINADLMFVGEAPGRDEDVQGRPFVGRAGRLLRDILRDIGIKPQDVYIANCLKCRPPNNRDPLPEELVACFGYLKQQISLIKPKIIATLGRYSTYELTNQKGALGTLRGKVFVYGNIKVIPLYHPAYLLRNPKAVDVFIEDLKKVKQLLEQ